MFIYLRIILLDAGTTRMKKLEKMLELYEA